VADPVGDLPHARVEGELVAAAFGPAATLLIGGAATRDRLTGAATCTHLHFATHGRHSWEDAGNSALSLADGASLSAGEIAGGLRLGAVRLAVLSACETGLTELGRTLDEYSGLPASLLAAGAGAVVSTLWTVDDATTALLVGEFYGRHLSVGEDSATALRGAQLWLRGLDLRATLEALEPARVVAARLVTNGGAADFRAWAAIENFAEQLEAADASDQPWASP
jgi:CHAT domain-containing protein